MQPFCAAQFQQWSVYGLPAFQTNYLWVITNKNSASAILIDPGCGHTVQQFLTANQLSVSHILITHHHADHIGGLEAIYTQAKAQQSKPPEIIATHTGRIALANRLVKNEDPLFLDGLAVKVLELPGHTLDHLGFVVQIPGEQGDWLFCGDTLFSGGCGRLFEGSYEQMFNSLQTLGQLAPNTLVFCAHEYTLDNLNFLNHYAPGTAAVEKALANTQLKRENQQSTIPSTIGHELEFNLFLTQPDVKSFAAIRRAKDG